MVDWGDRVCGRCTEPPPRPGFLSNRPHALRFIRGRQISPIGVDTAQGQYAVTDEAAY
jgi:hypothetical protein